MIISPQSQKVWKSFALIALSYSALLPSTASAGAAETEAAAKAKAAAEAKAFAEAKVIEALARAGAYQTTPEEARAFLKINLACKASQQPLELDVTNASLDDIAARVEKQLTSPKADPKLKVQIRGARPVRLSFESKGSNVAEVLFSAAMLAESQLWVFSDHLLIAPQTALSPKELDAVKNGTAIQVQDGQWKIGEANGTQQRRAFSTFIGNEIKGMKLAKRTGPLSPLLRPLLSTGPVLGVTTANQLSPESRAMLQQLVNPFNENLPIPRSGESLISIWPLRLTSDTQVRLVPTNGGELDVAWLNPNQEFWRLNWSLSGSAASDMMFGSLRALQKSQGVPAVTTPLDPSAGKS